MNRHPSGKDLSGEISATPHGMRIPKDKRLSTGGFI